MMDVGFLEVAIIFSHVVVVVVGIDEGLGCTWVCGLGLSVCILGGGMVL